MVNSVKTGQRNVSDLLKAWHVKNQHLRVGAGIHFVILQSAAREQIRRFAIRFCLSHRLVIYQLLTTLRSRIKTDDHGALKSMLSIVGSDKTFSLATTNNVEFHKLQHIPRVHLASMTCCVTYHDGLTQPTHF